MVIIFSFYCNYSQIDFLKRVLETGKISHAYIFYGDEGVGKKTLAKIFARAVFCEAKDRPCGVCYSCKKFLSGNHPDFFEIVDIDQKKQSFDIAKAREIIKDSYIKPNESKNKIYLLPDVDRLLPAASNSLLKILEDPPAGVVFLLTTSNKSNVMETILSRCVEVFVGPIEKKQFEETIKKLNLKTKSSAYEEILNCYYGNLGKAIFYMTNETGNKIFKEAKKLKKAYIENDELLFVSTLQCAKSRELPISQILKCLLDILLNVLEVKVKVNYSHRLDLKSFAKFVGHIEKAIYNLNFSTNVDLLISSLCCEIFM